MKLECTIKTVRDHGDWISLTLTGLPKNSAKWRDDQLQEITLPRSDNSGKTFYVGRKVRISIDVL